MCSPRNIRNNQNSLETVTSNSTVSVGQFVEFTLEASFLFYDCGTAASEQIVFGRDTNNAKKIKVIRHKLPHAVAAVELMPVAFLPNFDLHVTSAVWNHIHRRRVQIDIAIY